MYGLNLNPGEPPPLLAPGSATDVTVTSPGIASWGRRLAAYGVDVAVLITLTLILAGSGHPLPPGSIVGALFFTVYMIAAQLTTRNTIGKYILGIQVVRDYEPYEPPSIGRILIRETARLIVGIGIFFRLGDARRQGWHDLLGDTLVVIRPVNAAIRGSLIAALVVGFGSSLAVGTRVNLQKQAKAAEVRRTVVAESSELQKLQLEIDRLRAARGTLSEMQQNHQKVLPLLDRFEASVRRLRDLTQTLADQGPADKAKPLLAALSVYSTLLDIAALERQQSNVILSFAPGAPLKKVQADLQPLASQLAQLQNTLLRENQAFQSTLRASRGR